LTQAVIPGNSYPVPGGGGIGAGPKSPEADTDGSQSERFDHPWRKNIQKSRMSRNRVKLDLKWVSKEKEHTHIFRRIQCRLACIQQGIEASLKNSKTDGSPRLCSAKNGWTTALKRPVPIRWRVQSENRNRKSAYALSFSTCVSALDAGTQANSLANQPLRSRGPLQRQRLVMEIKPLLLADNSSCLSQMRLLACLLYSRI